MRRTIGGNAQDRRRARRAASRRTNQGLSDADVRDIQAMIAAASGSTGLPLSDRGAAWDSGAADKRVRDWAGADDAPNAKYGQAFFVKDGDGTQFGDYHLPFADVIDGKLTAVWRGVTAAAAALQGARGANVEGGDAAKPKIASYYAKARSKYGDDSIKVPWDASEAAGETAAFLLAYALFPDVESVEHAVMLGEFEQMFAEDEVQETLGMTDEEADALFEALGGKPSKGTKKDKRLKGNDDGSGAGGDNESDEPADDNMTAQTPEQDALDAIEDFAASVKCGCGHAYSEHSGAGGTCNHEDGRGTCRCGEFAYPDADVQALADAIVAARPDLSGFEVEVARIAERTLLALQAAAGDVVWGPEEGFMDLLNDVTKGLHPDGDDDWFSGPWAVDASVNLDKVLLSDDGAYYVAPITIDQTGEPVIADKTDWVSVEPAGYVETGDGAPSMRLQVTLRDLKLTADGALAEAIPGASEVIPEHSDEIAPPTANAAGEIPWTATFVPEGVLTEDGRAFAPGSIILPPDEQARQLPLTLMGLIETSAEGGHDRAKVAGRIDAMWREDESGKVKASGVFGKGEWGQMIAQMVSDKELTGLSVDIAPLEYEHVARSDFFDDSGNWTAVQGEDGQWAPAEGDSAPEPESLEEWLNADLVLAITKAVIGMATVCPFPAFGQAEIALAASGLPRQWVGPLDLQFDCGCTPVEIEYGEGKEEGEALTAAAAGLAPVAPPADWFADPEFTEVTPMTITDDGQIFGHAWTWDTCHLSFDQCVLAPRSETNYAYFMLGEIACDDPATHLAVGKITLDTGHAGTRLSRADATAHYDNTGTVAAHVQFGEDEFGGWFAGAINPELSEEKVRLLRGATVSGDWRGVDGNLELVGLLAVNVPGFPVPRSLRASSEIVDGEPMIVGMVAAGIVTEGLEDEIMALVREVAEPAEA